MMANPEYKSGLCTAKRFRLPNQLYCDPKGIKACCCDLYRTRKHMQREQNNHSKVTNQKNMFMNCDLWKAHQIQLKPMKILKSYQIRTINSYRLILKSVWLKTHTPRIITIATWHHNLISISKCALC